MYGVCLPDIEEVAECVAILSVSILALNIWFVSLCAFRLLELRHKIMVLVCNGRKLILFPIYCPEIFLFNLYHAYNKYITDEILLCFRAGLLTTNSCKCFG